MLLLEQSLPPLADKRQRSRALLWEKKLWHLAGKGKLWVWWGKGSKYERNGEEEQGGGDGGRRGQNSFHLSVLTSKARLMLLWFHQKLGSAGMGENCKKVQKTFLYISVHVKGLLCTLSVSLDKFEEWNYSLINTDKRCPLRLRRSFKLIALVHQHWHVLILEESSKQFLIIRWDEVQKKSTAF